MAKRVSKKRSPTTPLGRLLDYYLRNPPPMGADAGPVSSRRLALFLNLASPSLITNWRYGPALPTPGDPLIDRIIMYFDLDDDEGAALHAAAIQSWIERNDPAGVKDAPKPSTSLGKIVAALESFSESESVPGPGPFPLRSKVKGRTCLERPMNLVEGALDLLTSARYRPGSLVRLSFANSHNVFGYATSGAAELRKQFIELRDRGVEVRSLWQFDRDRIAVLNAIQDVVGLDEARAPHRVRLLLPSLFTCRQNSLLIVPGAALLLLSTEWGQYEDGIIISDSRQLSILERNFDELYNASSPLKGHAFPKADWEDRSLTHWDSSSRRMSFQATWDTLPHPQQWSEQHDAGGLTDDEDAIVRKRNAAFYAALARGCECRDICFMSGIPDLSESTASRETAATQRERERIENLITLITDRESNYRLALLSGGPEQYIDPNSWTLFDNPEVNTLAVEVGTRRRGTAALYFLGGQEQKVWDQLDEYWHDLWVSAELKDKACVDWLRSRLP